MAFCPNCGTQVEGRFCAKCGAPAGADTGSIPVAAAQIQAPGLTENMAAALCYLLGVITGVLFLVLAPYNSNRLIRFHAFQAIFAWVAAVACWLVLGVLSAMLGAVPVLGFVFGVMLNALLGLALLVLWAMLMYRAYNGQKWVLPVIGPLAEKQA